MTIRRASWWLMALFSLQTVLVVAEEPLAFRDAAPQRYQLVARASQIDQSVQAHPEIEFLLEQEGKPHQQHASVDTRVEPRGKLVIWLMGPNEPLFERINGYGLHAIRVHYANGWFSKFGKEPPPPDDQYLGKIRLEAATGEDHSDAVAIPRPDGMMERALQFVRWLSRENPAGRWDYFLTDDGAALRWERVILAGSSHGSTTAARFAKHQRVDRVVMFCGPRDQYETWQGLPSATPANRFFGFSHVLDGGWTGDHYCRSWELLGLAQFGPIADVDQTAAPFGKTRRLVTAADVQGNVSRAHGSVVPGGAAVKDAEGRFVHESVWKYLFTHPVDEVGESVPRDPDCRIHQRNSPGSKPNILHIHADDLRADGLGALGNPALKTPNLDEIVARGLTFRSCYTQGSMVGAVCLPSRTMLLTGRSWRRIPAPNDARSAERSLPAILAATGYQTFHVGKGGNGYLAGLAAFETSLRMDDRGPENRRLSSARHVDAAINFLGERTSDQPFYIYFAPPVPHDPRVAEARFHAIYDAAPDKMPLSPAFLTQHPFDNGEMIVRDERLAPWPRTPEDTRQQLADYYACVTGLDHHVGRLFAALRESGDWDNTLIVFSGDNGLSLGEHGLFGKQNLYEFGGMHVPLVIAGPGVQHGKSDALVYLMDLFPTLAEVGGATLPDGVEGRNLRPLIDGKADEVREVLYTGYRHCMRSIRDERWKLIRYPLIDKTQLFNLEHDPHELSDLAGMPEHAERIAALTARLEAEMRQYGDDTPLRVANPLPAEWTPPKQSEPQTEVPKAERRKKTKAR